MVSNRAYHCLTHNPIECNILDLFTFFQSELVDMVMLLHLLFPHQAHVPQTEHIYLPLLRDD